uniref:Uncharacterized protein n=1 Tax=Manihot esculenta TaxID=3983 RepID=A0A2C9V773_MANES
MEELAEVYGSARSFLSYYRVVKHVAIGGICLIAIVDGGIGRCLWVS